MSSLWKYGLVIAPVVMTGGWMLNNSAIAQLDEDEPRRPPAPPWIVALDTDADGEISAEELAKSAESLAKLDANSDGKLDRQELRPRPPHREAGGRGPGAPGGERPENSDQGGEPPFSEGPHGRPFGPPPFPPRGHFMPPRHPQKPAEFRPHSRQGHDEEHIGPEGRGPEFGGRGPEGHGPEFGGRGPEGRGPEFGGSGPEGRGPEFGGRGPEGHGPGFGGRGPEGRGPGFGGRGPEGRGPGFGGRGPEGRGPEFGGRGPEGRGPEFGGRGPEGHGPGFGGRGPEGRGPEFGGRGPEGRGPQFSVPPGEHGPHGRPPRFEEVDTNSDGTIDRSEFDAAVRRDHPRGDHSQTPNPDASDENDDHSEPETSVQFDEKATDVEAVVG